MHFFIPWFLELHFFFYFRSSIWQILHSYYSLFSLCENVHTWNVSRIPTLQKYLISCNRAFCCVSSEVSPLLRKGNSLALHIKGLVSFSPQWCFAVVYFFESPLLNISFFNQLINECSVIPLSHQSNRCRRIVFHLTVYFL